MKYTEIVENLQKENLKLDSELKFIKTKMERHVGKDNEKEDKIKILNIKIDKYKDDQLEGKR